LITSSCKGRNESNPQYSFNILWISGNDKTMIGDEVRKRYRHGSTEFAECIRAFPDLRGKKAIQLF